jgi:multidrug efflux pump subunit AcrB
MHIVSSALVHAAEETTEHASQMSPWVFGGVALATLLTLLVITLMVKVGD